MGYYPIALDLTGRRAVVIGGGPVGERKVAGLLAAGARVTVVAPRLTPALSALVSQGRIDHVARVYRGGDLDGHQLALVAVDDPTVTRAVVTDARVARIWVNAADEPELCDFILPSVLRRGDLVVAVTTGGASPALARTVRERLEAVLGEEYGELAAVAAEVRRELRRDTVRPDATTWCEALADDDLRRFVRAGRRDDARRRLRHCLGVE
ncbi:MAG: bifunctional precorrin-2 dehydrogenase/sirohydrochlorin ferrochelatase [Candidatus Rokubacteria bacterium]|nr:bifunctional precorrin-2 dehydrogenase/sirohydrochlorin ferrochelatase [Candidatus Rokubacteria bacterium]